LLLLVTWCDLVDSPSMLSYPMLVVELNTRLYTVWSSPYKGASQVTRRVERELYLEDGEMRSLLTQEIEGGPSLVREVDITYM
jgi:hypothetical protein